MFKEIKKRIYLCLMLITLVLVAAVVSVSSALICSAMTDTYVALAEDKLGRDVENCEIYIYSVELTAHDLAANAAVTYALEGGSERTLTQTLNDACNFAKKAAAAVVYSADGKNVYSSSDVGDPPTLSELSLIDGWDGFAEGDADAFLSVRCGHMARSYNGTPYDEESGIISCYEKIYSAGGNVLGYAACDILPSYLYSLMEESEIESQSGTIPLIYGDGAVLATEESLAYADEMLPGTAAKSSDGKYLFVTANSADYNFSVAAAVPRSSLKTRKLGATAILVATGLVAEAASYFAARAVAKGVDSRLEKLYCRMETDEKGMTE